MHLALWVRVSVGWLTQAENTATYPRFCGLAYPARDWYGSLLWVGDQCRMGVAKHRNSRKPYIEGCSCCDAWQHMVRWPTMTPTLASLLQHHLPQGTGLRALARVLNCAPSHLLRLARGERWAHLDAACEYVRVLRARHANGCPVCEAHTPEVVLRGELNGRLRRDGVRAEVLALRLLPQNGP